MERKIYVLQLNSFLKIMITNYNNFHNNLLLKMIIKIFNKNFFKINGGFSHFKFLIKFLICG